MPEFNERFCIGKITNSNGALALAEAVLSFAIRQYRNKGTNEKERMEAEDFILDEDSSDFWLSINPSSTRDMERLRREIRHKRYEESVAQLERDLATVNHTLNLMRRIAP